MNVTEFSRYERARIVGARGLQIAMDAPLLLKIGEEELEEMNFDPLRIAEKELDSGVLPISVNRPMPLKKEEKIEEVKVEENTGSDAEKIKKEKEETQQIGESGEMMELANPSDEEEVSEAKEKESSEE